MGGALLREYWITKEARCAHGVCEVSGGSGFQHKAVEKAHAKGAWNSFAAQLPRIVTSNDMIKKY